MNKLLVSVIIPAYNAEKFIDRCLQSVINQTYKDLQIIVINDGSTDNTLAILKEYEKQDNRITIIDQENTGVSSARNNGLKLVKGEYISFIDADDWMSSDMIERLVIATKQGENVDVVLAGFDFAESEDEATVNDDVEYEVWDQYTQRVEFLNNKRLTGMLWNKLFKVETIGELMFDESISYGEDGKFVWSFFNNSNCMVVTNEKLYHHVIEKTSVTYTAFSDRKYGAVYVWEYIVDDVKNRFLELLNKTNERITSVAVYALYEIKKSNYNNKENIKHLKEIVKKNYLSFVCSKEVSIKMKLFATLIFIGA